MRIEMWFRATKDASHRNAEVALLALAGQTQVLQGEKGGLEAELVKMAGELTKAQRNKRNAQAILMLVLYVVHSMCV